MDDGLTKRPRDRWQRLSLIVMAAGGISLLAAIVLLVLTLTGAVNKGYSGPGTTISIGPDISKYLTPQPSPTQALPTPSEAPIARIVIPRFDIDAPVVIRGVDDNNVMETPNGPKDVAWYDFSGKPGYGSNAVFSGHVDYIDYGPAVFWNLKDLDQGDIIEIRLDDGTVYKYQVASRQDVAADPPADVLGAIIGPTQQDVVTLITCGGTFDYNTQQYDRRVIVRAERVLDNAPGQAAGAAAPSS